MLLTHGHSPVVERSKMFYLLILDDNHENKVLVRFLFISDFFFVHLVFHTSVF